MRWALEAGYRLIDTAQAYGNEASVGKALRDSGVPREDVFITTKFFPAREDPAVEIENSLRRLGVDQVDLYLVHWPQGGPTWAWPGMQKALERGHARAIGVSNFSIEEVDEVLALGRRQAGDEPGAVQRLRVPRRPAGRLPRARRRDHRLQLARAPAATSTTRPWSRSPSASGARPPRCCCAGAWRRTPS